MSAPPAITPRPVARVYAIAAVLGPVFMLGSTLGYLIEGDGINVGVVGGVVGVWSCFALAIAFVGILRLLEPKAPRGAAVMTVLALAGFASGVAFNVQAIIDAIVGPEQLAAAIDAAIAANGMTYLAILAFLPWGWFVPISMVVVGILLWRTAVGPRWSAGLLMLAGILFVASRPESIGWLALCSDVALLAAMVPLAGRLLPPVGRERRAREGSSAGQA